MIEVKYNVELDKAELECLKTIVNKTISDLLDAIKDSRKQWIDPKDLIDKWWEALNIKNKLLSCMQVVKKDNLTYYWNYTENIEEFYKTL